MRVVLWMHKLGAEPAPIPGTGDIRTGTLPAATSAPSQTCPWQNRNTEIQAERRDSVRARVTARGEVGTQGDTPQVACPSEHLSKPWHSQGFSCASGHAHRFGKLLRSVTLTGLLWQPHRAKHPGEAPEESSPRALILPL